MTKIVRDILRHYETENAGTKEKLYRIMMQGRLAGTGKMVILPVDQGFEHGAARSFAKNPAGYDPHYHFKLAIDAGLNAFAAPLGLLETGADTFAGEIPLILKVNSSNSLASDDDNFPSQAITASVDDALRLGCAAIGYTIYPASGDAFHMMETLAEMTREAKAAGLAVVVWSYPRGGNLTKQGETAVDICAYAAHMAALLGANIIKVKPPTEELFLPEAKKVYEEQAIDIAELSTRIAHVRQSCFSGKRLVIFSGGGAKSEDEVLKEISAINQGGANGSIIGRNVFQRPRDEALALLDKIISIYQDA